MGDTTGEHTTEHALGVVLGVVNDGARGTAKRIKNEHFLVRKRAGCSPSIPVAGQERRGGHCEKTEEEVVKRQVKSASEQAGSNFARGPMSIRPRLLPNNLITD